MSRSAGKHVQGMSGDQDKGEFAPSTHPGHGRRVVIESGTHETRNESGQRPDHRHAP